MTSSNKPPRVIPGETLSSELVTWEAPPVADQAEVAASSLQEQIAALREQAQQRGYAEGHEAGLAAARQQVEARMDALETALSALTRPLERLDHRVEEEILALVQAISRQLVRREMRQDPGELVAVIRAGLSALPVASEDVVVRLHPEDAQLIRGMLSPTDADTPWRIQADPVIERGGCQIVSASSQIDGRLETRLGRVIADMLDDERSEERSEDARRDG